MKLYNRFLGMCALAAAFAGCTSNSDDPDISTPEDAQRTVIAYLIGDNGNSDLSSYLLSDFHEMVEGMATVDVTKNNLIVYSEMANDVPRLIRITKKNNRMVADTIRTYEAQNPLKVSVMSTVFNDIVDKYPAKSYGLVLASHGEGWIEANTSADTRWFGMYRNTNMNITDLRTVLEGMPHLDFILFDACYMQSIEVAYELKDHADYIIGSPTEIPGPGGAYKEMVPAIFAANTDYPLDIAKAYYDYYEAIYDDSSSIWRYGVAISVIETARLNELATLTRNILSTYAAGQTEINASGLVYYGRTSDKNCYYYDMDELMKQLTNESSEYTRWRQAFDAIQPYFKTTDTNCVNRMGSQFFSMAGAQGIYMFIPKQDSNFLTYYQTLGWYAVGGWKDAGW